MCGNTSAHACVNENCLFEYCKECISRNAHQCLLEAVNGDWNCFACNTRPLWELRGVCAALLLKNPLHRRTAVSVSTLAELSIGPKKLEENTKNNEELEDSEFSKPKNSYDSKNRFFSKKRTRHEAFNSESEDDEIKLKITKLQKKFVTKISDAIAKAETAALNCILKPLEGPLEIKIKLKQLFSNLNIEIQERSKSYFHYDAAKTKRTQTDFSEKMKIFEALKQINQEYLSNDTSSCTIDKQNEDDSSSELISETDPEEIFELIEKEFEEENRNPQIGNEQSKSRKDNEEENDGKNPTVLEKDKIGDKDDDIRINNQNENSLIEQNSKCVEETKHSDKAKNCLGIHGFVSHEFDKELMVGEVNNLLDMQNRTTKEKNLRSENSCFDSSSELNSETDPEEIVENIDKEFEEEKQSSKIGDEQSKSQKYNEEKNDGKNPTVLEKDMICDKDDDIRINNQNENSLIEQNSKCTEETNHSDKAINCLGKQGFGSHEFDRELMVGEVNNLLDMQNGSTQEKHLPSENSGFDSSSELNSETNPEEIVENIDKEFEEEKQSSKIGDKQSKSQKYNEEKNDGKNPTVLEKDMICDKDDDIRINNQNENSLIEQNSKCTEETNHSDKAINCLGKQGFGSHEFDRELMVGEVNNLSDMQNGTIEEKNLRSENSGFDSSSELNSETDPEEIVENIDKEFEEENQSSKIGDEQSKSQKHNEEKNDGKNPTVLEKDIICDKDDDMRINNQNENSLIEQNSKCIEETNHSDKAINCLGKQGFGSHEFDRELMVGEVNNLSDMQNGSTQEKHLPSENSGFDSSSELNSETDPEEIFELIEKEFQEENQNSKIVDEQSKSQKYNEEKKGGKNPKVLEKDMICDKDDDMRINNQNENSLIEQNSKCVEETNHSDKAINCLGKQGFGSHEFVRGLMVGEVNNLLDMQNGSTQEKHLPSENSGFDSSSKLNSETDPEEIFELIEKEFQEENQNSKIVDEQSKSQKYNEEKNDGKNPKVLEKDMICDKDDDMRINNQNENSLIEQNSKCIEETNHSDKAINCLGKQGFGSHEFDRELMVGEVNNLSDMQSGTTEEKNLRSEKSGFDNGLCVLSSDIINRKSFEKTVISTFSSLKSIPEVRLEESRELQDKENIPIPEKLINSSNDICSDFSILMSSEPQPSCSGESKKRKFVSSKCSNSSSSKSSSSSSNDNESEKSDTSISSSKSGIKRRRKSSKRRSLNRSKRPFQESEEDSSSDEDNEEIKMRIRKRLHFDSENYTTNIRNEETVDMKKTENKVNIETMNLISSDSSSDEKEINDPEKCKNEGLIKVKKEIDIYNNLISEDEINLVTDDDSVSEIVETSTSSKNESGKMNVTDDLTIQKNLENFNKKLEEEHFINASQEVSTKLQKKKERNLQILNSTDFHQQISEESEYSENEEVMIIKSVKKSEYKIKTAKETSRPLPKSDMRKNIRKIINDKQVAEDTKQATNDENERLKRNVDRQQKFKEVFEIKLTEDRRVKKVVLDFDEVTKKELITVNSELVKYLKPHQAKGIKFMWDACFESVEHIKTSKGSGCILAHCMGLGKTFQIVSLSHTLITHEVTGIKTILIVVPASTSDNWHSEFNMWLGDVNKEKKFHLYEMKNYKKNPERSNYLQAWQRNGGVMIIGYEMFRNLTNPKNKRIDLSYKKVMYHCLINPGPDLLVCDEGHLLKKESTLISAAIRSVKTLRKIALTGTPLQNNLSEYYFMIQIIKPSLLGTKSEFMNRFNNPIVNGQCADSTAYDVQLMKNRSYLLHEILKGCVQRYDHFELAPYLPLKQEYVIYITLSKAQIAIYQHYLDFLARKHKKYFFADFFSLQRVLVHPRAVEIHSDAVFKKSKEPKEKEKKKKKKKETHNVGDDNSKEDIVGDEDNQQILQDVFWWKKFVNEDDLQNVNVSCKLQLLFGILKECEKVGDKLLVFSKSILTLDVIEDFLDVLSKSAENNGKKWKRGKDFFRLDGTINIDTRTKWCKIFNKPENKRARLFLISITAGNLGINLIGANRVIIFDASFNPSNDLQAIFRVYRLGQKKECFIYRFIARGTMEDRIYKRQVTKLSLSHRVIDEKQIERHFTKSDLEEMYRFEPKTEYSRKMPLIPPKDPLLGRIFSNFGHVIDSYHEHESLLRNKEEEVLNEEQRKNAWIEYEIEKKIKTERIDENYNNKTVNNSYFSNDGNDVLDLRVKVEPSGFRG